MKSHDEKQIVFAPNYFLQRAARVWKIDSFFHLSQQLIGAGRITQKKRFGAARRVYFYFYRARSTVDKETPFIYYFSCFFISLRLCA